MIAELANLATEWRSTHQSASWAPTVGSETRNVGENSANGTCCGSLPILSGLLLVTQAKRFENTESISDGTELHSNQQQTNSQKRQKDTFGAPTTALSSIGVTFFRSATALLRVVSSNRYLIFRFSRNSREKGFQKAVLKEQRLRTYDLTRKRARGFEPAQFRQRTALEPLLC